MVELLLMHPVSAQGRDNVPYQCVLRGGWREAEDHLCDQGPPQASRALLSPLPLTLLIWKVKVGPPGRRISFCQGKDG